MTLLYEILAMCKIDSSKILDSETHEDKVARRWAQSRNLPWRSNPLDGLCNALLGYPRFLRASCKASESMLRPTAFLGKVWLWQEKGTAIWPLIKDRSVSWQAHDHCCVWWNCSWNLAMCDVSTNKRWPKNMMQDPMSQGCYSNLEQVINIVMGYSLRTIQWRQEKSRVSGSHL